MKLDIIISIFVLFSVIFILIYLISDNETIENFGFGSWIKKKAKSAFHAVTHPKEIISKVKDLSKKLGDTITDPSKIINKVKEVTDKIGDKIKHPISTLENIAMTGLQKIALGANKLHLPKIPKIKLKSDSHANNALNLSGEQEDKSSTRQPLKALLECKGAHLYTENEECPPTRKYLWSKVPDGLCCNSFEI